MPFLFLKIFENFEIIAFDDFTILFSGFLLTLSVYHFLLYFQHKDQVYLYYSLYTFLIFTSSYPNTETSIFNDAASNSDAYFQLLIIPREWVYNTLYLMFAKTLVALHIYKPKWNRVLNISIVIYFIVLFIALVYALITGKNTIVGTIFAYFFSPTIAVLALISFYVLYTMDTPLKYYVLIGSFIYLILAEFAFYVSDDVQKGTVIFYIGVIIENVLFSLALGHKQKLILQEKNKSDRELINQLKEKEKYDKELAELKISSLRSQMNPHFIFNSLNSIKLYIINNEKENAVYYLNKFSKLIRKILATTREKEISLSDEIETMDLYVNIENIRFNNEIEFVVNTDRNLNLDTIKIPSLILQPFLENAIWHGLSSKKDNKKLNLTIEKENDSHVKITITDNGIGRKRSAEINKQKLHKKNSIGIKLTEERLSNFAKDFQYNYSITFTDLYNEDKKSTGTEVSLKIPLL